MEVLVFLVVLGCVNLNLFSLEYRVCLNVIEVLVKFKIVFVVGFLCFFDVCNILVGFMFC